MDEFKRNVCKRRVRLLDYWIFPTSKKKAVIDKSDSDPHLLFSLELEEHRNFLYLLKPVYQLEVHFQIFLIPN